MNTKPDETWLWVSPMGLSLGAELQWLHKTCGMFFTAQDAERHQREGCDRG